MITTETLKSGIKIFANFAENSADELNTADGFLGDGDLGVTLIRGFRQVLEIKDSLPEDIGMAFFQCAKAFTKSSGSSYGTLLATGMMAIAKAKKGQNEIKFEEVSSLFQTALEAMQQRGKASLGDKTVLDAIAAARDGAKNRLEGQVMLRSISQAVKKSMDDLRGKQSQVGRARIFAEKSIGFDDPGMLAFWGMIEALESRI